MSDKKFCSGCSYFDMDLGRPRGQWYTCTLHKKVIVDDSQAEQCPDFWKIFTPKPERNEVEEMTDELKPCPFCGGSEIVVHEELNLTYCNGCSAETDMGDWNTRPIEDELNRRISKAKDLLKAEMGQWRSVPTGNLPDHFIQLRQTLDVLDGGGE